MKVDTRHRAGDAPARISNPDKVTLTELKAYGTYYGLVARNTQYPRPELLVRCLLHELGRDKGGSFTNLACFDRCTELLGFPVKELSGLLGTHGKKVSTEKGKKCLIYEILAAERAETEKEAELVRKQQLRDIHPRLGDVSGEAEEDDSSDTSDFDGKEVPSKYKPQPPRTTRPPVVPRKTPVVSTAPPKPKRDEGTTAVSENEGRSPKRIRTPPTPSCGSASPSALPARKEHASVARKKPVPSTSPLKRKRTDATPPDLDGKNRNPKRLRTPPTRDKPSSEPDTPSSSPKQEGERLKSSGPPKRIYSRNADGTARKRPMSSSKVHEEKRQSPSRATSETISEDSSTSPPAEEQADHSALSQAQEHQNPSVSCPNRESSSPRADNTHPNPDLIVRKSHNPVTDGKRPPVGSGKMIWPGCDSLKRGLEDSSSDSDAPLISKRRRFHVASPSTRGNDVTTKTRSRPTAAKSMSLKQTISKRLQDQTHHFQLDDRLDTRVLFENKAVPTSVLQSTFRVLTGFAEENDAADVYRCRENLPIYKTYCNGTYKGKSDEDNIWLATQEYWEGREIEAVRISAGEEFDSDMGDHWDAARNDGMGLSEYYRYLREPETDVTTSKEEKLNMRRVEERIMETRRIPIPSDTFLKTRRACHGEW